jgi:hypothetical protein
VSVCGSTSANKGRAPSRAITLAVEKKLNGVVSTAVPGPTSSAASASASASVPEPTPIACGTPQYAAIAASKRSTCGPSTNCWLANTSAMAARTAAPMARSCARKSRNGTVVDTTGS